ncbi:MAG TPA: class II glutamine amidotransferase [Candidatus Hydrogenedentes bacterium]|nr:class II glutamine amidotransferase [Candidatus Hydrogenedentota bacterium]HPG69091.1 class II glutamine amidotransferase [Candidatus Hydrogenedentota bacterium]
MRPNVLQRGLVQGICVLAWLGLTAWCGAASACRLYAVIAGNAPDGLLTDRLIAQPNSFKHLALSDNVDGWGMAYYTGYGEMPTTARGAIRASNDPGFDAAVAAMDAVRPRIAVAHIRHCTSGCCDHDGDSIPDPHPFCREKGGKRWVFAHNGSVAAALTTELMGADYVEANPPHGSGIPECVEDVVGSELYFIYLLQKIEENGRNVVEGIVAATHELIALGEEGMNFVLSDGHTLWGFRRPELAKHTLYYRHDPARGCSEIASQYPGADQEDWHAVATNELVVLAPGAAPVMIDVTRYVEATPRKEGP